MKDIVRRILSKRAALHNKWFEGVIAEIKKEPYGNYNKNFLVFVPELRQHLQGILSEKDYDKDLKEKDSVKLQIYHTVGEPLIQKIKRV